LLIRKDEEHQRIKKIIFMETRGLDICKKRDNKGVPVEFGEENMCIKELGEKYKKKEEI